MDRIPSRFYVVGFLQPPALTMVPEDIRVELETLNQVGKNRFNFVKASIDSSEEHEFIRAVLATDDKCDISLANVFQNSQKKGR